MEFITNLNKGKKMPKEIKDKMMNSLCKVRYDIFFKDKLIYSCLGHTELYRYCKEKFNISREIIVKIQRNNYIPKFKKYMYLKDLKIIVVNRGVSTTGDECSQVE